jgi:CRISPR system Cascade subunit CasE
MKLSRLLLNPLHQDVRRAIGDSHAMHALVMSLFPHVSGDTPRAELGVLYRLERQGDGERMALLVQSNQPPDFARLKPGMLDARSGAEPAASKDLRPVLDAISPKARFRFLLRGNATRRIDTKTRDDGVRRHGKRVPVRGEEAREGWVRSRLAAHGLDVITCTQRPDGRSAGRRRGALLTHEAHLFEGVVEVANAELARRAVAGGVGPGKAFGFGLLSLAPMR